MKITISDIYALESEIKRKSKDIYSLRWHNAGINRYKITVNELYQEQFKRALSKTYKLNELKNFFDGVLCCSLCFKELESCKDYIFDQYGY